MNNTAKQESIRRAYGDLYEPIDKVMFTNPHEKWYKQWLDTGKFYYNFIPEEIRIKLSQLETDNLDGFCWLKSLQGIDTNNGWIRIESDEDLPKEPIECWFIHYETIYSGAFAGRMFASGSILSGWKAVSHFRPIVKPEKPIY